MNNEKWGYRAAVAAFWVSAILMVQDLWVGSTKSWWILFLAVAMSSLLVITVWDYPKMTKEQLIKQVARLGFVFGVALGVVGWLTNSPLWIYGFLAAALSALVGTLYGAGVDWKELRDRRADERLSHPRRHGDGSYPTDPNPKNDPKKNRSNPPDRTDVWFSGNDNQKQVAVAGNGGGKAVNLEWGNGMIAALNKHFLLIVGVLLALITVGYGRNNHSTGNDWTAIVILTTASAATILAHFGVLRRFLQATLANYPVWVWMLVSIATAALLWKYESDKGFTFGEMPLVWIALASAIVAGLVAFNIFKPLARKGLKGLGNLYSFERRPYRAIFVWGVTLVAVYVFGTIAASQDMFYGEKAMQVAVILEWAGILGAVLMFASLLAFKK